jgi:hypothetical protein
MQKNIKDVIWYDTEMRYFRKHFVRDFQLLVTLSIFGIRW